MRHKYNLFHMSGKRAKNTCRDTAVIPVQVIKLTKNYSIL